MRMASRLIALGVLVCAGSTLQAQQFKMFGKTVQVHGFFSQGFAYSNHNDYLSMQTSKGSFEFTDGGFNMSVTLTDRFRIGAQFYIRNVGNLGDWEPQLDWAVADYRFTDWLGIRGGVVKTTMGLYNDTQDMEFLHTSALLPQSIYPQDLRDALIRHRGGDVYGEIPLKKLGSLSYTLFAGNRQDSVHGGYIYMLKYVGLNLNDYGGLQWGGDFKWNTPLPGFLIGFSNMNQDISGKGTWDQLGSVIPVREHSRKDQANQAYGQYTRGDFRLETEYRRWWRDQIVLNELGEVTTDARGWYVLGSYRISKRLEFGAYYSRLGVDWRSTLGQTQSPSGSPDRHLYDKVITARFDVNSHWNLKAEGHFMDGYGGQMYPTGFFVQDNPDGFKRQTNMLLLRSGWNF